MSSKETGERVGEQDDGKESFLVSAMVLKPAFPPLLPHLLILKNLTAVQLSNLPLFFSLPLCLYVN